MKNVSVRTKFIGAFASLILAIMCLGGVSVYSLGRMDTQNKEITNNWLPSVKTAGELNTTIGAIRRSRGQLMLAQTPEQVADTQKSVDKYVAKLAELEKSYEALISSDEERAMYEEFNVLWSKYEAIGKQVAALADQGNKDGAINMYLTDGRKTFQAAVKELEEIINYNDEHALQAGEKADSIYKEARLIAISIITCCTLLGLFMGVALTRAVSVPVTKLAGVMGELADAKWNTPVPYTDQGDEIGVIARAVGVFAKNGKEAEEMRAEQAREQEAKEKRAMQMDAYISEFESAVGTVTKGLSAAATEMQSSAQSMSAIAEQTSSQAKMVAAAANEASSNVQTVASAGEELSASISEISKQMSKAADVAAHAVSQATETDAKVRALSEAAAKVSAVVQMINEIASQTNLLALNATIESARAGEAGKGFAVVASEVKNLASETERATEDIAAQVNSMQAMANSMVTAIRDISETINQISGISVAVSSAVEEQGAATQEIARNVQEAAKGTEDVTSNISSVTQAAQETGANSTQVLSAASELARMTTDLTGHVDQFLSRVRSA